VSPPAPKAPASSYCWPIKPFDRQHPVRGSFGDPRMVFKVPPTHQDLMGGGGAFSFHFGVDIAAEDGTPVYPVVSGTVSKVTKDWVGVDTGGGHSFQYWHVEAAVKTGDRVTARKTVVGTILPPAGHVHLSELRQGRAINPLASGHLTPYADRTDPEVEALTFRTPAGDDVLPNFVRGKVQLIAEAYDTPAVAVPGDWQGMPVAPARLTWRIENLGGKVIVKEQIGVDFRETIPDNGLFWKYYARGTYQNCCVFGPHYSFRQPGCFLFELTREPFDTKTIPDGVYELIVTATDIRGNAGSRRRRFTVHNRPGWIGS
jgi:murein DD-endopeptidase MepM/ murein hydrolase activator NlpD